MTSEGSWLEITVEVAGIDAEIAADLLRQACTGGVAIETPSRLDRETETYVPDGDGAALVKGYLSPTDETDRILQNMRLALQTAPLQRPAVWSEPTLLADADWRDSWKRYFGVQRIGRRLVIVPSWIDHTPKPDDIVLRIDPGMAFGTGQHQTTAMCLAALEDVLSGGESVLDLGCGSGILAIAASKLGAAHIVAIDNDPQAIKATLENADGNNVTLEAREGSIEPGERFDVIVANISGLTLERLAPVVAASLNEGGALIASGFLDEALDGVKAAYEAQGLRIERVIDDGQWRSVIARRPAVSEDLRRFFVAADVLGEADVTITGDLAHRLSKVLRYRKGDSLVLTAGGEVEYIVCIENISAGSVTGVVMGERPAPTEAAIEVVVYQSLIRANRFDFVLEKGTEIGVSRFVPIMATRTQVQEEASKSRGERWQRLITEAAEQCGRGRLPTVDSTQPFEQAIRSAPGLKLMPYESERDLRLSDYLRSLEAPPAAVSVFIGPEGGWEPSEVALARENGGVLVTLGRRVMRAETAALVAAGIVLHELDR